MQSTFVKALVRWNYVCLVCDPPSSDQIRCVHCVTCEFLSLSDMMSVMLYVCIILMEGCFSGYKPSKPGWYPKNFSGLLAKCF